MSKSLRIPISKMYAVNYSHIGHKYTILIIITIIKISLIIGRCCHTCP